MQSLVASGYRWKTKDLAWLPEEPFLSYEIIDGELIVSRKPHLRHAAIIGKLCAQVYPAGRALRGGRGARTERVPLVATDAKADCLPLILPL
jgi:hypothetical protein